MGSTTITHESVRADPIGTAISLIFNFTKKLVRRMPVFVCTWHQVLGKEAEYGLTYRVFPVFILAAGGMLQDLRSGKISNIWILAGFVCSIFSMLFEPSISVKSYFAGLFLPMVLLWPLFLFRMIGAGDIKLISCLGCFLGMSDVLRLLLWTTLLGAGFSIVILCTSHQWMDRFSYFFHYMRQLKKTGVRVPYRRSDADLEENLHFTVPIMMAVLLWIGGFY